MSLKKGWSRESNTLRYAHGLSRDNCSIQSSIGMSKNRKTPEIRCKIEAIAVMGNRMVSKFKFMGRESFTLLPFSLGEYLAIIRQFVAWHNHGWWNSVFGKKAVGGGFDCEAAVNTSL